MKSYYVEAPVTAKVVGYVKADSEEQAIERFIEASWQCGGITLHNAEEFVTDMDWREIELHKQVNRGNVVHGPIGEAFAEEDKD